MKECLLIAAACHGDEAAFRSLVAPLRGPLHAHCQRMLGSPDDADDAMQDVMLSAWRALPRFEGRSSLNSWLHRIATNTCLTALEKRPRQALPLDREADEGRLEPAPGGELNPTEASYEEQESAALAAAITLRQLPAKQRAALILRDVLGFRASEAALTLGTSVASVNSALQRARSVVLERAEPEGCDLGDAVDGFVGALARGDVETLLGIAADPGLSAERSWSYSPAPAY